MANISSFPIATPTANDTLIGTKFIENKEATTNSFNLGEVAEFVAGYITVLPITIGTANGLSLSGNALSLGLASGSANGALSSSNWTTFNNKQNPLTGVGLVKGTGASVQYITDGSANWNVAYDNSITSIAVTGTTTKTLTMTQQDGGTLSASWAGGGGGSIGVGVPANGLSIVDDLLYLSLASSTTIGALSTTDWTTFNGKQAPLTFSGPIVNTSNVVSMPAATASANGYLTSTNWTTFNNKQSALTFTAPLVNASDVVSMPVATASANGYLTSANWNTFNNKQAALSGNGIVKSTGGTISYIGDSSTEWSTAYANSIVSAVVTGTTTKTLSLNQQDGGSITASWTDEGGGVASFNTRTGAVTLSSSDVTTALGYTPVTDARTITINGVTQSLAANQTWVVTAVETDTLASVTGRGASTSILSTFNFGVNTVSQTNSQPGITNTMTVGSNGGRGAVFYGSTGLAYGSRSMEVYSSNYGAGIKFVVASTGYEQSNNAMWFFYQNTQVGSVSCTDTATTYATSSDYRLKENIQPVVNSLDRVDALNPCRFNFIVNPDKIVDGFIAHEVQAIVPEAVTGVKDEVDPEGTPMYQGIDQAKLVPLLTAAIQELHAKVKALELLVNPQ